MNTPVWNDDDKYHLEFVLTQLDAPEGADVVNELKAVYATAIKYDRMKSITEEVIDLVMD